MVDVGSFLVALTAPLLRSVAGWFENAMEDKKVTPFEWKQLVATVVRVGVITAGTFFSIEALTGQADIISSAFAAVLFDYILVKIKPTKK